jgi:uncharacterized membrane protein YhaH (DUF805 family)
MVVNKVLERIWKEAVLRHYATSRKVAGSISDDTGSVVANRWSARKFWWYVEKFGHYLQFLCLLYYFIILFQTSSNKYHANNIVIIKQVHFILIKLNFYDHYFIDVCTFLKKIMLVVRRIQNCEFSGPRGPNGWRPLYWILQFT